MSLYLDTNVIIALIVPDVFNARAQAAIAAHQGPLIVSDFAAAEFSSVISRRVRTREFAVVNGRDALADLDAWLLRSAQRLELTTGDVALADRHLRRLDLTLFVPDALHIAIAQRLDAALVTFDQRMAVAARALGVAVAEA